MADGAIGGKPLFTAFMPAALPIGELAGGILTTGAGAAGGMVIVGALTAAFALGGVCPQPVAAGVLAKAGEFGAVILFAAGGAAFFANGAALEQPVVAMPVNTIPAHANLESLRIAVPFPGSPPAHPAPDPSPIDHFQLA